MSGERVSIDAPVAWEKPPELVAGRPRGVKIDTATKTQAIAALLALQANPGKWARLLIDGSDAQLRALASRIKHGGYIGTGSNSFETCTRSVDGEVRLYARYRGQAS